jgi:3-isopropylmalate/(R)-2-methylmalate dehydratase large subunit
MGKSLFDKLWDAHVVCQPEGQPALLYIDLHIVHEVTSAQAFEGMRTAGRKVRRTDRTLATVDHNVPTTPNHRPITDPIAAKQIETLQKNCADFGIELFDIDSEYQGICHVIGPESGATQPGKTVICGDSHTSTHGAFGAMGIGVGTSEVEHVLATQCLPQRKPKSMQVRVHGRLPQGTTAKDLALAFIGQVGTDGATGFAVEYTGEAVRSLSMDGRMTLCNLTIEAGARTGMVAPDDTTFAYLKGRRFVPKGAEWDKAVAHWRTLVSDPDAKFDAVVDIDAAAIAPQVTWGTSPGMVAAVNGRVPDPAAARTEADGLAIKRALEYMGLEPNTPIESIPIDIAFIGSCTNSRLEDLREAARVAAGHRVAPNVRVLVVPGSYEIKRAAEREGLDRIFLDAGFEWREAGCSMCLAMNADTLLPGQRCASTSNRNFEGRQGRGGRTHLVSPAMAAAAAIAGHFTDIRKWEYKSAAAPATR